MEMRSQVSLSRSRQREAWVLAGMMFLITPSSSVVTPMLPDLMLDFHLSVTGAALIISCFSLAQLAFDLPVGLLLDRFNHRRLLVGGILCAVLGSMLSALAFSFPRLLLGRLLAGAGVGICITTTMVMLSRLGTPGTRGSLFGQCVHQPYSERMDRFCHRLESGFPVRWLGRESCVGPDLGQSGSCCPSRTGPRFILG